MTAEQKINYFADEYYDSHIIKSVINDDPVCVRCGHCCWYLKLDSKNKVSLKKCRHLITYRAKNHLTCCRVWGQRNARLRSGKAHVIEGRGKECVVCLNRGNSQFDYMGCPYNTNKPLFEDICKKHGVDLPWMN